MNSGLSTAVTIKVADIVFALSCNATQQFFLRDQSYKDFYCDGRPEVKIDVSFDGVPHLPLRGEDRVFDSGEIWSLYRIDGKLAIVLGALLRGNIPYRIGVFNSDFKKGWIHSLVPETGDFTNKFISNPFGYPLAEVLMICLLAQGRGIMAHACGIDDSGRGYLFAGNSTHGKSTVARLWKDNALVLNDDRIVLRLRSGRFWMYGTPWHGDYSGVSPHGVPLEKIFFLRHAQTNSFSRREGVAAASMLFTRCFPPLWDAEGMKFTLDFCAQLVDAVPCYKLDFVPDENIIDFVRCVK